MYFYLLSSSGGIVGCQLLENLRVINDSVGPGDEIHGGQVLAINHGFIEDVGR